MSDPISTKVPDPARTVRIEMHNVGDNDGVAYAKADVVLACHLNTSFALSFYQIDYQSIISQKQAAEQQTGAEPTTVVAKPIIVAKVVLDREGFARLYKDIASIARKNNIEAEVELDAP